MKQALKNEDETIAAARKLAAGLKGNEVVFLDGPLGAGKSVFARALIRAMCGEETEVPSPTFTLLQTYDGTKGRISHYDFYRVKSSDEIFELGWEEALNNSIIIAEWPERLGAMAPRARIEVRIAPVKGQPDAREIEIKEIA